MIYVMPAINMSRTKYQYLLTDELDRGFNIAGVGCCRHSPTSVISNLVSLNRHNVVDLLPVQIQVPSRIGKQVRDILQFPLDCICYLILNIKVLLSPKVI